VEGWAGFGGFGESLDPKKHQKRSKEVDKMQGKANEKISQIAGVPSTRVTIQLHC
jgi:hypothetical protein